VGEADPLAVDPSSSPIVGVSDVSLVPRARSLSWFPRSRPL